MNRRNFIGLSSMAFVSNTIDLLDRYRQFDNMKDHKLKPCPFCGKDASYRIDARLTGNTFTLGCCVGDWPELTIGCPGQLAYKDEDVVLLDEAVKLWNTRI